ncbi:MAG: diphthine--ammonia ligase [Candidatus Micrarchaeales archaeon]|jgi:ABC transporter with metal-binding/Fe-S-binding domain ATP-binding protein
MTKACLFSGGKDSMLALHKVIELGIKIDLLITMKTLNKESYMFHYPNVDFSKLQAKSLSINQVFGATEGKKEKELEDLERIFVENDVRLLVTGATYSKYQADRINAIAKKLEIDHIAPLWHIEPLDELNELVEKYNVIITSVSAEGLDTSLLGRRIDIEIIEKLIEANKKHGVNLLFEGGEAETFVLDAPLFKKKIKVEEAHVEKKGENGVYLIDKARLVPK